MDLTINVRNIDLRDAQEQVENNLGQARRFSRSAIRTYAGFWGLTFDEARRMLQRSRSLMQRAEERGENIEDGLETQVDSLRERIENERNRVESRLEERQRQLRSRFNRAERRTEKGLEEQVERTLDRLGIPSKEQIQRLSAEIEALSAKIDSEIVTVETTTEAEPFAGYDAMNVREIMAQLEKLTLNELHAVRSYETSHENRVTIKREVDRRIESMPIPRYDELTVEEIEVLLPTLNKRDLDRLETYEKRHENRVTLLRSIRSQRKQMA